ncbi:MAG: glycosyltransferase family 1 protein [Anaerolineales bacterium]|nr:glycosyltransferase family 1 protein [Anaerolineales bacterium]
MRILLMTYGTRGDVEPFVALARGFVKAGHAARLAAPEAYAPLAQDTGVEYLPLPGNPGELAAAMVRQAGDNPLRMIGVMTRFVFPLAAEIYARLRAIAPGSDAIVHSFLFTHAGYELAKSLGVPDYSAQMFPMFAPTSEFAAPGFPIWPLPGIYRRMTHVLFNNIFRHGGGLLYNQVRRSHPDMPPLTGWPFSPQSGRVTPLLFGFSEQVVPRPADWPDWAHITGYWQLDPPGEGAIPAELYRFLERGAPPVFIGFGSYSSQDAVRLAGIARDALKRSGQRGILPAGNSIPPPEQEDADIFSVGSVPHRWLFPQMSAVVHHGGAGTTGVGLRAGVPNIVIPFTADQPFWAARVRALGAGPEPIPLRKLTAEKLAAAIDQSLHDAAMRARCRALGVKIDAEDGVERAVERAIRQSSPGR